MRAASKAWRASATRFSENLSATTTTVGTVGGQNSAQGPHLYFEIRGENQIALDPIAWLKNKG